MNPLIFRSFFVLILTFVGLLCFSVSR